MFSPENPFGGAAKQERREFNDIFKEYIARHVADIRPMRVGRREAMASLAGSAFGCKDSTIHRCNPVLKIGEMRLQPGKSIVLIGPNGGGKTTVFHGIRRVGSAELDTGNDRGAYVYGKSMHGKETHRVSQLNQEEILVGLEDLPVNVVLEKVKDFFSKQFPVDWENGEAYEQNLINQEAEQRIEELGGRLEKLFRMSEFSDRLVSELSGGERTKLSLCMVLLSEPDTLLLDEPTNHLDLESIAKLSGLIELYTKAGVAVLSVSHVNSFLEEAGKDGVLEIRMTPTSRELVSSSSSYGDYIRDRAREESSIIEGPIKWPDGRNRRTGVLINSLNEETTIVDSPLKDVEVPSLLADDVWVLSGRNGSGKTRLMEAMVKRKGNEIFERGKGVSIAYLPQFWPEEVAEGSVETFFDWIHETTNRLDTSATSKNFVDAVKKIGFRSAKSEALGSAPFLRRKLSSFSGGEQRLLWFVAVSCFQKVDALFLDEPTNHMDKNLQAAVTKAIQDFPGAVVFSTHDLQLLDATAKNVGNKGATMAPKNIVLDKTDGETSITLSDKNPADYMRSMLNMAKKEAKRLSGKL